MGVGWKTGLRTACTTRLKGEHFPLTFPHYLLIVNLNKYRKKKAASWKCSTLLGDMLKGQEQSFPLTEHYQEIMTLSDEEPD